MADDPRAAAAKRGRPAREVVLSRSVSVRLSTREYAAMCKRADTARVSVAELIRRAIRDPE